MIEKNIQMLVGPTKLPRRVTNAMSYDTFSHRGEYYKEVQYNVMEGIKKIFKTQQDVLVYTASGTGAIEAAIMNLFNPGDEIVIPINSVFCELLYDVSLGYDLDIKRVELEYGTEIDVHETMKHVTDKTKGVFIIHNASSTGVVNNIEEFGRKLKDTNTLLMVDSVSGAGGVNIEMDNWHLDVVLTASQKALMAPPGLAFVSLSDKAWKRAEQVNNQKYYFNFLKDRNYAKRNLTVHTPATHTLLAVAEALKMIEEEGLENVLERHKTNAQLIRDGVKKLGFTIYAQDESYASPTVTTILAKGEAKYYVEELAKRNILVGGGKSPLSDDTFRIGTMGYVSKNDVEATLVALADIQESKKR